MSSQDEIHDQITSIIKTTKLDKNDVIFIKSRERLSIDKKKILSNTMRKIFPKNMVVFVEEGFDVEIVSPTTTKKVKNDIQKKPSRSHGVKRKKT